MTDFLYPFLGRDERDAGPLLVDLAESAQAKSTVSGELRAATLAALDDELTAAALAIADRFGAGGRLLAFGNGGSSTDAASVATLFAAPPWGRALGARCLAEDTAILTALGNDVG
ncbi:MAG: phosphoheptose isomerase, partial [Acidimicrobiales bacterium]